MTSEVLNRYTRHTLLTDPGPYTSALEALPDDLDDLHHAIDGLFIHVWKVRKFHPARLEQHAVFVRSMRRLLEGVLDNTLLGDVVRDWCDSYKRALRA